MSDKEEITVQDVANAVSIIDICVKRGAIEGGELTAVGTVRDKLAKYVDANRPKPEENKEPEATE